MKKTIKLLSIVTINVVAAGFLFVSIASASDNCFLVQENSQIIKEEGDCNKRYSPASTFKIPLSLMGYDIKILEDETHPEWQYNKKYELFLNIWKGVHNPRSWMRDSCVWYSQELTDKLGIEKFKNYVTKFDYGNKNISGDKGKNNGISNSWLSSSLEISPKEQVKFLQKLIDNKLPVSKRSSQMTKNILFREELAGGWMLYGKTGSGRMLDLDGANKTNLQHGWFVGWIEKNGKIITFAQHIVDDQKNDVPASFRAKNDAINKLFFLINEMEK